MNTITLDYPKSQNKLLPNYPKFAGLWLINLAFFFIQPILSDTTPLMWAFHLTTLSIFLGLFVYLGRSQSLSGKRMAACAMWGLAIATSPYNTGSNVFFIFASANYGHLWRAKSAAVLVCLTVLSAIACQILWQLPLGYFLIPAVVVSLMIGFQAIWMQREEEISRATALNEKELQQLAAYAERERIGRDLHDLLGHSLSVIQLRSQLAKKYANDPTKENLDKLSEEIDTLISVSKESLQQVRESVVGMRSQTIENELTQLKVSLRQSNVLPNITHNLINKLPPLIETQICLILRELVTNVLRHSGASKCQIELTEKDTNFQLTVKDNGKGCSNPTGNGTQGIEARVHALKGSINWQTDTGCQCTVLIPTGV